MECLGDGTSPCFPSHHSNLLGYLQNQVSHGSHMVQLFQLLGDTSQPTDSITTQKHEGRAQKALLSASQSCPVMPQLSAAEPLTSTSLHEATFLFPQPHRGLAF